MIPPGMEICLRSTDERAIGHEKSQSAKPCIACSAKKRRAAHDWDDLEGVVVDVEITDWPTATQNPRGRVVEILGYEDDFGVDVEIMIRKFHLPHRFPAGGACRRRRSVEPVIPASEVAAAARLPQLAHRHH